MSAVERRSTRSCCLDPRTLHHHARPAHGAQTGQEQIVAAAQPIESTSISMRPTCSTINTRAATTTFPSLRAPTRHLDARAEQQEHCWTRHTALASGGRVLIFNAFSDDDGHRPAVRGAGQCVLHHAALPWQQDLPMVRLRGLATHLWIHHLAPEPLDTWTLDGVIEHVSVGGDTVSPTSTTRVSPSYRPVGRIGAAGWPPGVGGQPG